MLDKKTISQRIGDFAQRSGLNCTLVDVRPHPYMGDALFLTIRDVYPTDLDKEVSNLKWALRGEVFDFVPSADFPNSSEIAFLPWEADE